MTSRKIIVIGESGVGKTSLVRRLVHREFASEFISTFGVDIYTHVVAIPPALQAANGGSSELRLMIWDTQGDLDTRIFTHPYGKGTTAALIVADMTDTPTHETLLRLARGFEDALPGRPSTLAFNKLDLWMGDRPFEPPAPLDPARHRIMFTSAKGDVMVRDAFDATGADIVRRGL